MAKPAFPDSSYAGSERTDKKSLQQSNLIHEPVTDQLITDLKTPLSVWELAIVFLGTVYHSILREIGFKKNLSSRVVRTECARRNGWAGPGFGKKLSWSRENEVWLALSVREE